MIFQRMIFATILGLCVTSANAQTPGDNDLLALRFYIEEGNDGAVQSELRRLQLEYPSWTPPEDLRRLERGVPANAIDRIYSQIREGEYEAARQTIEQTSQDFPDWSPSQEVLETLSLAEAQTNFTEAVERRDAEVAIRIARGMPALLRCERINNTWLLAEQYHQIGQEASALAIYRSVLKSCGDLEILVATLEKSATVADAEELAELTDVARAQAPDSRERLTTLEKRLRAGLGAAAGSNETVEIYPDPTGKSNPTNVAPTQSDRPITRPAQDAVSAPAAPRAKPQTQTLAPARGDTGQASRAAARGDWQGCLALLSGARSADQLSQRGWCALNSDREMQAINDFRRAASSTSNARLQRDSLYGLALAMLETNMVDQAAQIVANTHFDTAQRLELETQILDKRGIMAFGRKDYRKAIAYFNEMERLTGLLRRDLALLRGYSYLNSNDRTAAIIEFRRLHDQMATPASRRGLSQALESE